MVERLRAEYDGDYPTELHPTLFQTAINQNEMVCGTCRKVYFVDKETLERVENALEYDSDNLFICDECGVADQDAAFEQTT